MSLLLNKLDNKVILDGKEVYIDLDFRNFIRLELMSQDPSIDDFTRITVTLNNFYGTTNIIEYKKAIRIILDYYTSDGSGLYEVEEEDKQKQETGSSDSPDKPILDFDYDVGLIYAAFMEQYNIDLIDIDFLHWWKFKALLLGLNENTKLSKVMYYRSVEIDSKMDKEQKKFLREMKKLYALPDRRTDKEKEKEFHNIMGGLL